MNLSAIQHFAYDSYCYQLNNDDLEISIITGKDVNSVFLLSGDPFARGIMGGNNSWVGTETEKKKKKELQNHYRWTVKVSPQFKRLSYCFRIVCGSEQVYLTHDGFETKEQYEILQGMKVRLVQGYYFDRPMPKKDFESKYV